MEKLKPSKLVFQELDRSIESDFLRLYQLYEASFPDPNERESLLAFDRIYSLIEDNKWQSRFGPYREVVITIRDLASNEIVGGLIFGITTSSLHIKAGYSASVQAIYLFVDEQYRGLLRGSTVLNQIRRRAAAAFPQANGTAGGEIAIFFEANNPTRMTLEQIDQDYDNSGLDPYRRYHAWLHFAKPLQFHYIQPALANGKAAVKYLDLFFIGKGDRVPADMLLQHLRPFVSLSVLKGQDAEQNADFASMARELGNKDVVALVPLSDGEILDIMAEARERVRASAALRRRRDTFPSPTVIMTTEGVAKRPSPLYGLRSALYAGVYRLYHILEEYHIAVSYIELVVGAAGIVLVAVTWIGKTWVEPWLHDAEVMIVGFLSLYIGSRGLVRTRRSRLGPDLSKVWQELHKRDMPIAAMPELAADWLREGLLERLRTCTSFGPMLQPGTRSEERQRLQRLIAAQSAQVYSERVWGRIDLEWQNWELKHLEQWLGLFPAGLVGATFKACPGQTFYGLVLPIRTPVVPLTRLALDHLEIDDQLANFLQLDSGKAGRIRFSPTQQPPCLLVLRQAVSGSPYFGSQGQKTGKQEQQLCTILTIMLQLALLLEKLVPGGDLLRGVPEGTSVLIVASNRHTSAILEWFGFRLLQRATSAEWAVSERAPGQANLSVYKWVVGEGGQRAAAGQRALELMTYLRNEFRSLRGNTSPH